MEQTIRKLKATVILTLYFSISLLGDTLKQELDNISFKQKITLAKAYIRGEPYGLEYSLCAIAWQESKAGKWLINISDPSFGVFHIKPKGDTWAKSREAEKLLDFDYSATKAIELLLYWKKYHKGDWKKMIKSYNAGFNYDSQSAKTYLGAIQKYVRVLKKELGD